MLRHVLRILLVFAFCLSLMISTAAVTLAAGASITLSSTVGPPTKVVTVKGSGFGLAEAVKLFFDALKVGTSTTDSSGSFSKGFRVPNNAQPGNHTVTATGQVSGLSATASFLVRTDWSSFGYNPQHTRWNTLENTLNPGNASSLALDWTAHTGNFITSSPAVAGGLVYIGSADGSMYAFNYATGATVWSVNVGSAIDLSSPTVAGGVAYVGAQNSKLYAFSAATGKLRWTASTGNAIESSPTVAGGVIYVGSEDHNLYAFNAATGVLLWTGPTGGMVDSSPAVAGGAVYVGSFDHDLYAFNAAGCGSPTCSPLWIGPTGGTITSSPAVANGVVYVGSQDGNLYAFEAAGCGSASCSPLWTGPTGLSIVSSPAVANGVVYIGSLNHNLYAFEAVNGLQLAVLLTSSFINSSPAVANGVVYVGSLDHNLYAFHLPGTTP
jgi:outer membrane protein assembly factor BamB